MVNLLFFPVWLLDLVRDQPDLMDHFTQALPMGEEFRGKKEHSIPRLKSTGAGPLIVALFLSPLGHLQILLAFPGKAFLQLQDIVQEPLGGRQGVLPGLSH